MARALWALALLVAAWARAAAALTDVCAPTTMDRVLICSTPVAAAPSPGDTHALTISAPDVVGFVLDPSEAVEVNGVDVLQSLRPSTASDGAYDVAHVTAGDDTTWPWSGLSVRFTVAPNTVVEGLLVTGAVWQQVLVSPLPAGSVSAVCVADWNHDGLSDAYVTYDASADALLMNMGNVGLSVVPESFATGQPSGCAFGDFDADGDLDVFVTHGANKHDRLYVHSNNATFGSFDTTVALSRTESWAVAVGDVDGDGTTDAFVTQATCSLYVANPGSALVVADESVARGADVRVVGPATALLVDIDGDAFLDIVVVSSASGATVLRNGGDGFFTDVTASVGLLAAAPSVGVAAIGTTMAVPSLWFINADGNQQLFQNHGTGVFSQDFGLPDVSVAVPLTGVVALDIELDGDVDVLQTTTAAPALWLRDAGFRSARDAVAPTATSAASHASLIDVDNDGDMDVLVGSPNAVYVNPNAVPGAASWVKVRPLTAAGTPSAFGAAVTMTCVSEACGAWTATRAIDGGGGSGTQSQYDAHFGVPAADATYNVSVLWPANAWPRATWASHSGLGGVVPSALHAAWGGVLTVRPTAPTAALTSLPPVAANATIVLGVTAVAIPIQVSTGTMGLRVTRAVVNGVDVTATAAVGRSEVQVEYTTAVGDTAWPWRGLDVDVVLRDSSGLHVAARGRVTPGSAFESSTLPFHFSTSGMCVGDVNQDGFPDVLVLGSSYTNSLHLSDGSGGFTVASNIGLRTVPDASQACVFADFNGDGYDDLYEVVQYAGDIVYMWNTTASTFEQHFTTATGIPPKETEDKITVAVGDVNGDGHVDVYLTTASGTDAVLMNSGSGTFSDQAAGLGIQVTDPTFGALLADLNGDGALDILVPPYNLQGPVPLFINHGSSFVNEGTARGLSASASHLGASVFDINNDGNLDVCLLSFGSTLVSMFVNDGGGVFTEQAAAFGLGVPSPYAALPVDIDHDGDVDLMFAHPDGGFAPLYLNMQPRQSMVQASPAYFGDQTAPMRVAVVADVDGDGDMDVVGARVSALYINTNAQSGVYNYLKVQPLTDKGAPALAARVAVECVSDACVGWQSVSVIDGGGGFLVHSQRLAHFGVPHTDASYNVTVRWAGDAWPLATWVSHPGLGRVVPSVVGSQWSGTLVVRPQPLALTAVPLDPIAPGATVVPGDVVAIHVTAVGVVVTGLHAVAATVNGVDVADTFAATAVRGTYSLTHMVRVDDTEWPWAGLRVELRVSDSTQEAVLAVTLTPGSAFVESFGDLTAMSSDSNSLCVADANHDGLSDVFVGYQLAVDQVWTSNGDGTFVRRLDAYGAAGLSSQVSNGCVFADFNDDGYVDLFVSRKDERDSLYLWQNSPAGFTESGADMGVPNSTVTSLGAAVGDVNGDGWLDVYVPVSHNGQDMLLVSDGAVFSDVATSSGLTSTASSMSACFADVDGDGDQDLAVARYNFRPSLYINVDGAGTFHERGIMRGFPSSSGPFVSVVVWDANGDTHLDFYVADAYARGFLLLNDGTGTFTDVSEGMGVLSHHGAACVTPLDVELDGDMDLLLTSHSQLGMLFMNHPHGLVDAASTYGAVGTSWNTVTLDADNDGDLDVMSSRTARVLINTNAQPGRRNWLLVRPLTATGAPSAFGATVTVVCVSSECLGWRAVRVAGSCGSRLSSSQYDAHFGLPDPGAAYNVTVRWAGDHWLAATWATHPGLGAVVPSQLLHPVMLVRSVPLSLWLSVEPRDGALPPPSIGEPATVFVSETQQHAGDLEPVSAVVNGVDVAATWSVASPGQYALQYVTPPHDTLWPWQGLHVALTVADGVGTTAVVDTTLVPRSTFVPPAADAFTVGAHSLCVGHLNNDTWLDVYVSIPGGDTIWLGDGTGQFTEVSAALGLGPVLATSTGGCLLADVNDDGLTDIVLPAPLSAVVLLATSGGSFVEADALHHGLQLPDDVAAVVGGDVNGDGMTDVFVASPSAADALYLNAARGQAVFQPVVEPDDDATVTSSAAPSVAAVLVDVDASGSLDVVVAHADVVDPSLSLYMNTVAAGTASFSSEAPARGLATTDAVSAEAIAVADVTFTGCVALLVARMFEQSVLFVNDCTGHFTAHSIEYGVRYDAMSSLTALDMDMDGRLMEYVATTAFETELWRQSGPDCGFYNDAVEYMFHDTGDATDASDVAVVADFDGDGDGDVLTGRYYFQNTNSRAALPRFIRVRPLTSAGAAAALGATVTVTCSNTTACGGPWTAARVVDGGSGGSGSVQNGGGDVVVAVATPSAPHCIRVAFPSSTVVHGCDSRPALGGVVPATLPPDHVFTVRNLPVFTNATVAGVSAGVVNASSPPITVVLTLGGFTALPVSPAPTCCLVNGVQVAATFAAVAPLTYTLTYTPAARDASWPANRLQVLAPLVTSAGDEMDHAAVVVSPSPGGDMAAPALTLLSTPPTLSNLSPQPVSVQCDAAAEVACTMWYTVNDGPPRAAPPAAYTSPTSAVLRVGPLVHGQHVSLAVWAVDAAGNVGMPQAAQWSVDLTPPATSIVSAPVDAAGGATRHTDAVFSLACSEAACGFEYQFDGGAWVPLAVDNTTAADTASNPNPDTAFTTTPPRASSVTTPAFVVSVAADVAIPLSAVVELHVDDEAPVAVPLLAGTNTTAPATLPPLSDGWHVATARLRLDDSVQDPSPAQYVFRVDTVAPVLTLLESPATAADTGVVAFRASEPGCTFQWREGLAGFMLNAAWQPAATGVVSPRNMIAGAQYEVQVVATDAAGNVGPTLSTSWVPVGCPSVVPLVVITSTQDLGGGTRWVAFRVADPSLAAWDLFEFRLDGGPWRAVPARDRIILPGLGAGDHDVAVRAGIGARCLSVLEPSRPAAAAASWTNFGTEPPAVAVVDAPPASSPLAFAQVVVELTPGAPHAFLECRLNADVVWAPCDTAMQLGPLLPGAHTLRLRGTNAASGAVSDVVRVSWGVTAPGGSEVVLSAVSDGGHQVTVRARDAAGNVEPSPPSFPWRVDTTPPGINGSLLTGAFSASRQARVRVACGGEVAPCVFCWESVTVAAGCSPNATLHLVAPADGPHVVLLSATDSVGLVSTTPATVAWTVDSTPPATAMDFNSATALVPAPPDLAHAVDLITPNVSIALAVAANEPLRGVDFTVNGAAVAVQGPFVPAATVVVSDLQDGGYTLVAAGEDLAGNVDPSPAAVTVLVDTLPPNVTAMHVPTSPWPAAALAVTVAADDAVGGSGVASVCVVLRATPSGAVVDRACLPHADGAAGSVQVTAPGSGAFTVTAHATDAAGNADPSPPARAVAVDLDFPVSSFGVALPAVVGSSTVDVVVVVADEPAAASYARSEAVGVWVAADPRGVVTLTDLPDGSHRLQVRSVDGAGNEEQAPYAFASVVVDTVQPFVQWVATPPEWSLDPNVTVCVAVLDASPVVVAPTAVPGPLPGQWCIALPAAGDGRQSVSVGVVDAAGNAAPALHAEWVVDRVPPLPAVLAPVSASDDCVQTATALVCSAYDAAKAVLACAVGPESGAAVSPCRVVYLITALQRSGGCGASPTRRRLTTGGGADDTDVAAFVPAAASGATTLAVDTDGQYSVAVRAVDAAGNVNPPATTLHHTWFVDTTPPSSAPELLQSPDAAVTATTALFEVSITDASPGDVQLLYTLNDGPTAVAATVTVPTPPVQVTVSDLAIGSHVLRAWVRDQVGHDGPAWVFTWQVVDTAPSVTLLAVPAPQSGDAEPVFQLAVQWPAHSPAAGGAGNHTERSAAVEVNLADGFVTACSDTVATHGVCQWTASLETPNTYTLTARTVLAGVVGDPVTYTWSYHLCSDDEYAEVAPSGGIQCLPCPPGAVCDGGLTTQAQLLAREGWWAAPTSEGLRYYQCRLASACPGGVVVQPGNGSASSVVVSRCAAGYTGPLCDVCADGYFEQFGRCAACTTTGEGQATLITLAVTVAYLAAGGLFFKFRRRLPKHQMKVGLTMFQVIASANTAYSIPWPPVFLDFLNIMRVFLIEAVSMTRANCAQPMSFYDGMVATFIAFTILLALVLFGPAVVHRLKHRRAAARLRLQPRATTATNPLAAATAAAAGVAPTALAPTPRITLLPPNNDDRGSDCKRQPVSGGAAIVPTARRAGPRRHRRVSLAAAMAAVHSIPWPRIFRNCFLFLFVTYPAISLKVMRMFKCVEVEGTHYLVADMRLECYTSEWYGYAVYAAAMGCLFTVGMPLSVFLILFVNRRRLDDPVFEDKWGFLYLPYGNHAYLWEVEELLRKLWLSALVVLMPDGSPLQVTSAVLVSAWAHVAHAVYKPWSGGLFASTYRVQHVALFVTTFVFLMGLLFKVDGVAHDSPTYSGLAVIMLLLVVLFAALWVVECARGFMVQQQLLVRAKRLGLSSTMSLVAAARNPTPAKSLQPAAAAPTPRVAVTRSASSAAPSPKRHVAAPMFVRQPPGLADPTAWSVNPMRRSPKRTPR